MNKQSLWGSTFAAIASASMLLAYTHKKPEYIALGITNLALGLYVMTAEAQAKAEHDRLLQMIKSRPVMTLRAPTPPPQPVTTQHISPPTPTPTPRPEARKKVLPPGTIATHPRGYKPPVLPPEPVRPAPAPAPKTEKINQSQYQMLVKRLQGDRAQADRLINHEQSKAPERTRQWALEKALDSLSRDRL